MRCISSVPHFYLLVHPCNELILDRIISVDWLNPVGYKAKIFGFHKEPKIFALFVRSCVEGRLTFTVAFDHAVRHQLLEGVFNGSFANRRDKLHNFTL